MKPLAASILGLGIMLALPAAQAQQPDTPVMGSSASGNSAAADPAAEPEKHAPQMLVIGDALAGGLGAGLARVAGGDADYDVTVRFNEESGLARPEVYDWVATVPKILESTHYDVIVVMLGANDRQVIRSGNMRYPFNTDGWADAYRAQVDALLDALSQSGAKIVWVAPPPMQDPEYDAAMRSVAQLQRERVEAKGQTFLDTRPALTASDGSYIETGPDDTGAETRLRGKDGISFFKAGNNRMGQLVLAALGGADGTPRAKTSREDTPPAEKAKAEAAAKQPLVPVFGQALDEGVDYTVQPEGVTANALVLAGAGLDSLAAMKALRGIAPQGSNAELLFSRGLPAAAPAGRADDFSAPPAP